MDHSEKVRQQKQRQNAIDQIQIPSEELVSRNPLVLNNNKKKIFYELFEEKPDKQQIKQKSIKIICANHKTTHHNDVHDDDDDDDEDNCDYNYDFENDVRLVEIHKRKTCDDKNYCTSSSSCSMSLMEMTSNLPCILGKQQHNFSENFKVDKTNISNNNNNKNSNSYYNSSTKNTCKKVQVTCIAVTNDNQSLISCNSDNDEVHDQKDQRSSTILLNTTSLLSLHQEGRKYITDLNDVQNLNGKNLKKATTSELLINYFSLGLNNTAIKNQKSKLNIDVNLKNNENRKFNDLRSGTSLINNGKYQQQQHYNHTVNEDISNYRRFQHQSLMKTSIKKSSSSSLSTSSSSSSSEYSSNIPNISSLSNPEKDFLYCNCTKKRSLISFDNNNSINVKKYDSIIKKYKIIDDIQEAFSSKLGSDGTIFWNNCYFYDEDYCTHCSEVFRDYRIDMQTDFTCLCSLKKVDSHEIRPRSIEESIDFGLSINDKIGSNADGDIPGQNIQNQVDFETRKLKRGHVLTELLETERIYVSEINSILKGYRDAMFSQEMIPLVPSSLQGKEDILFGNLEELCTFHSEIFLKDLENCISTTELVALCFVQRRDTFYRLYSFYCQNIPRSERLRETLVDTHLFLQECQKRLGHKLPLAAYLLKPVQRITKYQLLLKDLLKFSDSRTCTKELQKALDCMLIVLKCVNDSMHQISITGFPTDLSQQGELLLQDSFQIWTESKKDIRLRLKTQHRHIFLYQKAMLFCKQSSKTGHNKSTYQFKHYLKMSQIGLTESIRGDSRRFEVWLQGRQEVHTLQAPNIETKNKWVSEIKRVLLNQLRELKGEKIKQYGLSHRKLRETMSCDTPCLLLSTPQRTISCDGTNNDHTIMNRMPSTTSIVNKASINECQIQSISPIGINSLTSSDKDIQEIGGWSSDYSNSEDELSVAEENNIPGNRFIALADYCAVGHSEVSMKEGDIIELLKIGCAGWWFVKILDSNAEGWTPAAYLEPINRKSSRSSSRNQDQIN